MKVRSNKPGVYATALTIVAMAMLAAGTVSAEPGGNGKGNGKGNDGGGDGGGTEPTPTFTYSVVALGDLGGGYSKAEGMNLYGDVVGSSNDADGWYRAFLSTVDGGMVPVHTLLDPQLHDLYEPTDPTDSSGWFLKNAADTNDAGQIAGTMNKFENSQSVAVHAFRLDPPADGGAHYTLVDLGTAGGGSTAAISVTSTGAVVGRTHIAGAWHVVTWPAGAAAGDETDLGSYGGDAIPENASSNPDTNELYIAGRTIESEAWRYSDSEGFVSLDDMLFSHRNFRSRSEASGVNASGDVTGFTATAKEEEQAFLYTDTSGMISLGSLNDDAKTTWTDSDGVGINDLQEVVGLSSYGEFPTMVPFLDTPDLGMVNLLDVIDPQQLPDSFIPTDTNDGFEPVHINDAGMICGNATRDFYNPGSGGSQAFLLTRESL